MDALDKYCTGLKAELPALEQGIQTSCQVGAAWAAGGQPLA
jgi:hypothetical protein